MEEESQNNNAGFDYEAVLKHIGQVSFYIMS